MIPRPASRSLTGHPTPPADDAPATDVADPGPDALPPPAAAELATRVAIAQIMVDAKSVCDGVDGIDLAGRCSHLVTALSAEPQSFQLTALHQLVSESAQFLDANESDTAAMEARHAVEKMLKSIVGPAVEALHFDGPDPGSHARLREETLTTLRALHEPGGIRPAPDGFDAGNALHALPNPVAQRYLVPLLTAKDLAALHGASKKFNAVAATDVRSQQYSHLKQLISDWKHAVAAYTKILDAPGLWLGVADNLTIGLVFARSRKKAFETAERNLMAELDALVRREPALAHLNEARQWIDMALSKLEKKPLKLALVLDGGPACIKERVDNARAHNALFIGGASRSQWKTSLLEIKRNLFIESLGSLERLAAQLPHSQ